MKQLSIAFFLFTLSVAFINCKKKAVAPSSYNFPIIQENYDSTLLVASNANKNICLMIHASWCNTCNTFKANVLADENVVNIIKDKIVFAMIDGDKTYGKTYFNQFQLSGFPTFILLDKNGVELSRKSGGLSSSDFKTWVTPYLK
jgi:thioredoxin-related protein